MGILTKYLLRAHAGPFLFAFTALTGLLFLNAVAQRMQALVGKGLGWGVVGEFLMLSLPHTVALTLPMAVLVAVLYTFSELTSSNEITAMAAGGVKPLRLMAPLLGVGVILALGMLHFNDEVLPESNHDLKLLILDLGAKSPTFNLEEQVINEIDLVDRSGKVYLVAREIDNQTSELTDVVIYDLTDPSTQRTTYADRGEMAFNRSQTDLYLTLYDGVVHEVRATEEGAFTRARFERQILPLRGVGTELERRTTDGFRSDREMSLIHLQWAMRGVEREIEKERQGTMEESLRILDRALNRPIEGAETGYEIRTQDAAGTGSPGRATGNIRVERDPLLRSVAYDTRQSVNRAEQRERSLRSYQVEYHKKLAISYACIVFVMIGAPLAIRFPRGGVGMVIFVSFIIFAVYWAGLIGGEELGNDGVLPPWLAMWAANIVFTLMGLGLMARMGHETATNRGGGFLDEILWRVSSIFERSDRREAVS